MLQGLLRKEKIILLLTWSFFSFSVIQFLSIFIYTVGNGVAYFSIVAGLNSILLLTYYFVYKSRFGTRLNYWQYMITSILSGILITGFSYGYYLLVMLNNDYYNFRFYVVLIISNIFLGSLLFLFTRIKKK